MNPDAKILGESSGGREVYDGRNEGWTDSKDPDPPKRRLGSPIDPVDGTGGGGYVNGDVLEDAPNPDGRRTELGYYGVVKSEYRRSHHSDRSGMFKLFLRDDRIQPDPITGSDDPKYQPFLTIYAGDTQGHPAVEIHPTMIGPLRQLLGVTGGQYPTAVWSPSGLFLTQHQDDGNLVAYKLRVPFDIGTVLEAKLIVGFP